MGEDRGIVSKASAQAGKPLNVPRFLAVLLVTVLIAGVMKHFFKSDWFEFAGVVTGVLGVYLVAVENILNWPIGIVNVSLYAYVFWGAKLYADMVLQFVFFALCIHGWVQWVRGGESGTALRISRLKKSEYGLLGGVILVATLVVAPIIKARGGEFAYVDSALAITSVTAQFLLNRKKVESWILWILVDIVYIPVYIQRGLQSTAVLYVLFLGLAISGLLQWLKTERDERQASVA